MAVTGNSCLIDQCTKKNLLDWNYCANWNQTLKEWCFEKSSSKLIILVWSVKNMKPTSNSCFRLANMQNNFSETHDNYFVGTVDMSRIDLTYICDLHFVGTYLDSYVDYMLILPSVYDLCWNKHLGHKKKFWCAWAIFCRYIFTHHLS